MEKLKMAKKLSLKQQRNIKSRQENAITRFESESAANTTQLRKGIAVCRHKKAAEIETEDGSVIKVSVLRTVGNLVAGDDVLYRPSEVPGETSGVVETVMPRKSELKRPDLYDGLKTIVANIDLICIVASVTPEFSTDLVDRYIVAAADAGIEIMIAVNKIDLASETVMQDIDDALACYEKIGYRTVKMSQTANIGIDKLKTMLDGRRSILVGQSGVGKSTILNALAGKDIAKTGEVSEISGLGCHTTTSSRLYRIGTNGIVIDTPGVREFGLWHLDADSITKGFKEFAPFIGKCKFRDCNHSPNSKGCAIKDACDGGIIDNRRYLSYARICESTENTSCRNGGRWSRKPKTSEKSNV